MEQARELGAIDVLHQKQDGEEHQEVRNNERQQEAGEDHQEVRNNQQRQARPPHQNCPRCGSIDTKFCYYNNNSITQPRYFCRTCKRYWTQGGTLRDIPVGGSSRRDRRPNKRTSSNADHLSELHPAAAVETFFGPDSSLRNQEAEKSNVSLLVPTMSEPSMHIQSSTAGLTIQSVDQAYIFGGSDFALLGGLSLPSYGLQQELQSEAFHIGGVDDSNNQLWPIEQNQIHTTIPSTNQELEQTFYNGGNVMGPVAVSCSCYDNNNGISGSPFEAYHWTDFPDN